MLEAMKIDPDTGKVKVWRVEDGKELEVYPVDARELAAMDTVVLTKAELPSKPKAKAATKAAKPAAKKAAKKTAKAEPKPDED
jgi:hypothetical protein